MTGSPNVFANNLRVIREPDLDGISGSISSLQSASSSQSQQIQTIMGLLDFILAGGAGIPGDADGDGVPDNLKEFSDALRLALEQLRLEAERAAREAAEAAANATVQASIAERLRNLVDGMYNDTEAIRQMAQDANDQATALLNDILSRVDNLQSWASEVQQHVTSQVQQVNTSKAEARTWAQTSLTAANSSTEALAQVIIERGLAVQAAIDASQSADAASTSETQALAYSNSAQTFANLSEQSANEASADRDFIQLEAGALINPGFEGELALIGQVDVFAQGWEKSSRYGGAEWEKLGFAAPLAGGEPIRFDSRVNFGFVSLVAAPWSIQKWLRVDGVTELTVTVQAWLAAYTLPGSITRDANAYTFVGDNDAAIVINCYDAQGASIAMDDRARWSDSLTQYQFDTNALTGAYTNDNRTLTWTFDLPAGTHTVKVELVALGGTDSVILLGTNTQSSSVRFDNIELSANGVVYDITGNGLLALQQARAAVTARNESEAFATDAETFALASESSSIQSATARDDAQTAAGAASTSAGNALTYANDAQAFATASENKQLIATAVSAYSQYLDIAPNCSWPFDDNTVAGWSNNSGTTVSNVTGKALRVEHSAAPGRIVSPDNLGIDGERYNKLRIGVKVISGTLVNLLNCRLYYTTTTRTGLNVSYAATPLLPLLLTPDGNGRATILFDTLQEASLVADDWTTSTIKQLFFSLDTTSTSLVYDIEYAYVLGERADTVYLNAQAAITSASNASASETLAEQYADAALADRLLAQTAAGTAETHATSAATSATTAEGAATTATTQAGLSASAKFDAETAATNAATSANNAATSATNAGTAETGAESAADAAALSASNAATSESNAAISETNAATSASTATGAAATATTQASLAATSASTASTAATNAGTSESNASTYAANALISETNAVAAATSANDAAAEATSKVVLAARVGAGTALTRNPIFEDWSTTLPAGYSLIDDAGGTVSKETLVSRYGTNAVRFDIDTSAALGIRILEDNTVGLNHIDTDYVVVDVDVEIISGTNTGKGISLVKYNTADEVMVTVNSPITNWVQKGNNYTLQKVFDVSGGTGTFAGFRLDLHGNSADMGTLTATGALRFHKAIVRLATAEEIRTFNIDDDIAAAVAIESSARASAIGSVEAKYGVKVTAGGHVAGFGLIATDNDATPTSEFIVEANNFKMVSPGGGVATPVQMFTVGLAGGVTSMTINGNLLADGTISASRLNVAELSAISADFGTMRAGLIESYDEYFAIDLDIKRIVFYDNSGA